jgi:hypothetical protein
MQTRRMMRAGGAAAVLAAALAACSDITAPELEGKWGGPDATLTLSVLGGSVEYACGAGTIDAGWRLDSNGAWTAAGRHSAGGGPAPIDGRPSHPAIYAGTLEGDVLTFTVEIPELDVKMGPFRVVRGMPGASEMCV